MKYCTQCGSEYEDSATKCTDDGSVEFVSREELHRRGLFASGERDTRKFVRVGSAEDPLTAERFTRALDEAGVPVFARPRRAGTVDLITSGVPAPWWEILVPEEQLAEGTRIIERERADIEANAGEAAAAAEAEFDAPQT